MNQRDRLKELIQHVQYMGGLEERLADYLLENGVIVPPCKVENIVYALWDVPTVQRQIIYCSEIVEIRICKRNCRQTVVFLVEPIEYIGRRREYRLEDFGKTLFFTREEAEKAL